MKLSNPLLTCWFGVVGSILLSLLSINSVNAQVPQLINYQGRVVVGSTNFNGSGQFAFALVNTNGTTTYWSNDGTSTAGSQPSAPITLTVTNGLYSVVLGDTAVTNMTAVPASVFTNSDVRLRVWFNDGTHGFQLLTPDQRIAAVGYAMVANTAESVAPGAVNSAAIAPGAVGSSQLASSINLSGTVTAASFTGSGSGLTSVNAATLGSLSASSFAPASGSASYIQNSTSPQTGSFNLSGNGVLGGTMTAFSFSGNGFALTNLSAANVTGTLTNATLPSPYTPALSFSNAQGTFTLVNSATAPVAAASGNAGQLYFDTTEKTLAYSDGSNWNKVLGSNFNSVSGIGTEFMTTSSTGQPISLRTITFTKHSASSHLIITYSDSVELTSGSQGVAGANLVLITDGVISNLQATVVVPWLSGTTAWNQPVTIVGELSLAAGSHTIAAYLYPAGSLTGITTAIGVPFMSGATAPSYYLGVEEVP